MVKTFTTMCIEPKTLLKLKQFKKKKKCNSYSELINDLLKYEGKNEYK